MTKQLSEDQRKRVRTLYFDGNLTKAQIAAKTGYTPKQIRNALLNETPQFESRGRRPFLSEDHTDTLIDYVTTSKEGRRASWQALARIALSFFGILIGWVAIRNAFHRRGFKRYHARLKPPISETNRKKRLAWAEEHKDWTIEQWRMILWSDETWVTGGSHRKVWVTRRRGEEFDQSCIVERHQKKNGWMFWGSFSGIKYQGSMKGPAFHWEKEWGYIDEETYRERTVPLVDGWLKLLLRVTSLRLVYMQDGASGHRAAGTIQDLKERGVKVMEWPPFSPDLNPIEYVWNWMKNYIEDHYGSIEKPTHTQLRGWTLEAWHAVPEAYLEELLATMPQRCADVIKAEGRQTKW